VPGAFVSLIAHNALDKIILEQNVTQPSAILMALDKLIINAFKSEGIRDGMDIGICSWNNKTKVLQFSGAYHSLFISRDNQLEEIKGNRESIGYSLYENKKPFMNHQIKIDTETMVYLSSDGYPDQFGGENGKKLKWSGFRKQLIAVGGLNLEDQSQKLKSFFVNWKNGLEQIDDVCVMGVKLL